MQAIDVIRRRRNALLHNAHRLLLFSPFDNIVERTECRLYDLSVDR